MRIQYVCRHCKHMVGEIHQPNWTQAQVEQNCGFSQLTPHERLESIQFDEGSGMATVQTVCEYCQGALESHPELLVEGKLLQ